MSEWKEVELGEVASYKTDKIEAVKMNVENYISTENMLQDKQGIQNSSYVPTEGKVSKFEGGNILVSNIRPYFKKIWYAIFDGGCSNDVIVFEAKKNVIDSKYLYFQLSKDDFFDFMMAGANGTKMPRGNKEAIPTYKILLPPLPTQQRIASILSAYDDLIENNLKRIKLLEEIAQRTYEEWFVKFRINGVQLEVGENGLPEGWEKKRADKIMNLLSGYAFKGEELLDEPTTSIAVRMGNFKVGGGLKFEKSKYINLSNNVKDKFLLKPMDLVMVLSDVTREGLLIGNVGLIPKDNNKYYLNQRVSKIEIHEDLKFYAHSVFSSKSFKQNCLNKANSATVLNLKNDDVYSFEILFPNQNVIKDWNKIYGNYFIKIMNLESQNRLLKESRDILLPRLMSGKVRV